MNEFVFPAFWQLELLDQLAVVVAGKERIPLRASESRAPPFFLSRFIASFCWATPSTTTREIGRFCTFRIAHPAALFRLSGLQFDF